MSEHAIREYLKTIGSGGGGASQETDPVFTASPAHGISAQDIVDWNDKQEELVSGTNIKTINGQSLLGSGDLPVAPPVTSTDVPTADTISEFDSDAHMNSTDMTTGSGSELEDFIEGLNVLGGGIDVNSTDHYIIIGDIGICWGRSTTGSNSACSPSLPLTYADVSKMYVYATSVYGGSNTYVSVTVSSQISSTSSLNLYARCGSSTTGANYGIQWLVIGKL